MGSQIIFYEKNKADYSIAEVVATASQSSDFARYALNRSNLSSWVTSGSVDADNTTFEVDLGDYRYIDTLFLIQQNFGSLTAQWYDGANWQNFTPAISTSGNTLSDLHYEFNEVLAKKVRLTITGTMVANQDKYLAQFIATEKIGQLNGWPVIKSPTHFRGKKISRMLSGKVHVVESMSAFRCELVVPNWKDSSDLQVIEDIYTRAEGVLVWLCGGSTTQFSSSRIGYRKQDIYLMRPTNDYVAEFARGLYGNGLNLSVKLEEASS